MEQFLIKIDFGALTLEVSRSRDLLEIFFCRESVAVSPFKHSERWACLRYLSRLEYEHNLSFSIFPNVLAVFPMTIPREHVNKIWSRIKSSSSDSKVLDFHFLLIFLTMFSIHR